MINVSTCNSEKFPKSGPAHSHIHPFLKLTFHHINLQESVKFRHTHYSHHHPTQRFGFGTSLRTKFPLLEGAHTFPNDKIHLRSKRKWKDAPGLWQQAIIVNYVLGFPCFFFSLPRHRSFHFFFAPTCKLFPSTFLCQLCA